MTGSIPQALLLTAVRGTGEVEFALRIARSRLCHTPMDSGDGCGSCEDCRWFKAGTHPDFRRLDPALDNPGSDPNGDEDPRSNEREARKPKVQIPIDDVRDVSEFLRLSSYRGGARVVLIHPAQAMTAAASNALLKVLEEPPDGSFFILVSSQPSRLPATVRSRCTELALPKPPRADASAWLRSATTAVNPDLALAQVGGAPYAAAELGDSYWAIRSILTPFLCGRDQNWSGISTVFTEADLPHVLQILQTWCWDLMSARFRGEVRYHPDLSRDIAEAAPRMDGLQLAEFARRLSENRRLLGHPLNARLLLEDLLISYKRLMRTHERV